MSRQGQSRKRFDDLRWCVGGEISIPALTQSKTPPKRRMCIRQSVCLFRRRRWRRWIFGSDGARKLKSLWEKIDRRAKEAHFLIQSVFRSIESHWSKSPSLPRWPPESMSKCTIYSWRGIVASESGNLTHSLWSIASMTKLSCLLTGIWLLLPREERPTKMKLSTSRPKWSECARQQTTNNKP